MPSTLKCPLSNMRNSQWYYKSGIFIYCRKLIYSLFFTQNIKVFRVTDTTTTRIFFFLSSFSLSLMIYIHVYLTLGYVCVRDDACVCVCVFIFEINISLHRANP
jgi:hypothetical protein